VISRLLSGEDYVIGAASTGISIRLFGKSAAHGTAAPAALPPAAQTALLPAADGAAAISALLAAAHGSRLVALRQARATLRARR